MAERLRTTVVFDRQDLLTECLIGALSRENADIDFTIHQDLDIFLSGGADLSNSVFVLCPPWSGDSFAQQFDRLGTLVKRFPEIRTVVLVGVEHASEVFECLRIGAKGYIPLTLPLRVVAEALRLVVVGSIFIPPSYLLALSSRHNHISIPNVAEFKALDERENLIAEALKVGASNKDISKRLKMGESTVKLLVRGVMRKMNAKNRTEVAYLMNRK